MGFSEGKKHEYLLLHTHTKKRMGILTMGVKLDWWIGGYLERNSRSGCAVRCRNLIDLQRDGYEGMDLR